ncbi:hypothetical protein [Cyanobium gracile]|uniref:Uncharacterized protein n=1 Tax=Cyanobium gracile (strain ATCC 27147 / PCC 6307) TaxID=292564 RepID=K9P7E1_CYAGP|nr:hypothetical protein [Cyanobium gracile]AFY28863.1 hypothetical protein Cyagr_1715 [Cyanobium gracile PCC 6307]
MEPTLDSLLSFYAERIGGPFPPSLLPTDLPLHWQGQTLFGTARGTEPLYLLQSTRDAFLATAPLGTFSVGFWGHGLKNHAFYYQRREPWGSLYLHLAYGGLDDDNEQAARRIRATMEWLAGFLPIVSERARHCIVVDSLGDALFRIVLTGGQAIEGDGPLFEPERGPAEALRPLLEGL